MLKNISGFGLSVVTVSSGRAIILMRLFESYMLLKKAFWPLLDSSWSEDEIRDLEKKLCEMKVNYHDLRTRVAGNYRFIDLHVTIPENESVGDAHRYCDMIEEELSKSFDKLNVITHVEPGKIQN